MRPGATLGAYPKCDMNAETLAAPVDLASPAGRYAKARPAGGRVGLARAGYPLAVVQPVFAERDCRSLVVGFAVSADNADRDGSDNERVGRVLFRAQGSVAGEGVGQAVVSADCHRGFGLA